MTAGLRMCVVLPIPSPQPLLSLGRWRQKVPERMGRRIVSLGAGVWAPPEASVFSPKLETTLPVLVVLFFSEELSSEMVTF